MLNRITLAILCTLFASASVAYIVEGTRISRPQMLSYAKNKLQNQGTVEQTANGITYLKIPDSYTKELLQQIQMPGYGPPKQSQIPIIGEHEAKNIIKFSELGKTVRFKPLGFYTIMEDNLEYFVLAVDAPELSYLRTKYGLSEKLENHDFKVVIGVRTIVDHDEIVNTTLNN